MLRFLLFGVIAGILFGILFPLNISLISGKLLLIIVLVGFDVLLSSTNAKLLQQFDYILFTNEFILNSIMSLGLVYLGSIMGQNLFPIVALVLVFKIFYNLSGLTKTIGMSKKNNS